MTDFLIFPEELSCRLLQMAEPLELGAAITACTLDLNSVCHLTALKSLIPPVYLNGAQPLRLHEFFCGRALAEAMLQQHYNDYAPLSPYQERLPQWPQGIQGSISHSRHKLVVALSDRFNGLGVDIEHWVTADFAQESAQLVLTEYEMALWQQGKMQDLSFCQYLTLIFSVKESLYKAVYGRARHYIDFLQASVCAIDLQAQQMSLQFCSPVQQRFGLYGAYYGYWRVKDHTILTWVTDDQVRSFQP